MRVGLVAAALALIVTCAVAASRESGALFHGDARAYRIVAQSPLASASALRHLRGLHTGTAYRYGRIGAPFLAWLLALGRPGWVTWTFPLVNALALGAAVAVAAALLRSRGIDPSKAIAILAVPGLAIAMTSAVVEPLAIACALGAWLAWERGRRWPAIALAASAVLTREVLVLAFVPLVLRDRDWRWTGAVLPYGAWSAWLRHHLGHLPLTDPARQGGIGLPGTGLVSSLRHAYLGLGLHVLAVGLAIVVLATLYGAWRMRNAPLGPAALSLALIATVFGAGEYDFVDAGLRVLAPAHVFLLLAIFQSRQTGHRPRAGVAQSGSAGDL